VPLLGLVEQGHARVGRRVAAEKREAEEQGSPSLDRGHRHPDERQRRLEALCGGEPGVGPPGALARADQPVRRPLVARALKVRGHGIGIGPGKERLGDPAMPAPSPWQGQALVERLADPRGRTTGSMPRRGHRRRRWCA